MTEPTDAQLAETVRDFAKYLVEEMGWLSDGKLVLEHLRLAAQRLEGRGAAEAGAIKIAQGLGNAVDELDRLRSLNAEMRGALDTVCGALEYAGHASDDPEICLACAAYEKARAILFKTEPQS